MSTILSLDIFIFQVFSRQAYPRRLVILLLFCPFHFSNDISFIITAYVPLVAQCAAATCGHFTACSSSNLVCVCFSVSIGGGICAQGDVSCASLTPCNNNTLTCNDPRSVCIVNSCCAIPVCQPLMYAGESVCPTNYSNSSCKW